MLDVFLSLIKAIDVVVFCFFQFAKNVLQKMLELIGVQVNLQMVVNQHHYKFFFAAKCLATYT